MPSSILLVQPALNEASVISLGLLSIATYLGLGGHDAKVVVLSSEDDTKRKVREYSPTVVGLSLVHSFQRAANRQKDKGGNRQKDKGGKP